MTPEVRELYDALVKPSAPFYDARTHYEKLRERLIKEIGYEAFRERQREAFRSITFGTERRNICIWCTTDRPPAVHEGRA